MKILFWYICIYLLFCVNEFYQLKYMEKFNYLVMQLKNLIKFAYEAKSFYDYWMNLSHEDAI